MRKYTLPLLSLYLDFITVMTVVGLVDHFAGEAVDSAFGSSTHIWIAEATISLVGLTLLRILNLSVGDALLAFAIAERAAGVTARQWPNLWLGTITYLSGLKELVRWTQPGEGLPFLFMVEDTRLKVTALTVYGALFVWAGVCLLRFDAYAKLLNATLLGFGAAMMAANFLFMREAMVAAQVTRRINQGLPADESAAEAIVAAAPIYGGVFIALLFILLHFCRERTSLKPAL